MPDVTLPRIGLVGAPPPAETTLVVTVTRKGRIWCGDEEVDWEGYEARVVEHALGSGATEHLGGRDVWLGDRDILLRLDALLPYAAWEKLIEPLYGRRRPVTLPRIHYGVCSETTGEAGALALFAYTGRGAHGSFPPGITWDVCSETGDSGNARPALYERVRRAVHEFDEWTLENRFGVLIQTREATAFGSALQMLDAASRGGAVHVDLGLPTGTQGREAWKAMGTSPELTGLVRALPAAEPDSAWTCEGVPLDTDAPPVPTLMPQLRASVGRNAILDSGVLFEMELEAEEEQAPEEPDRDR